MKLLAAGIAIIVCLAVYQYVRRASELQTLELADRCQVMGARFANEIKSSDKEIGVPAENRDFTHRVHYNAVERKCFVLTEGDMTMPLGIGRVTMTQIWDASGGVGSPVVAERDVPLTGRDAVKFYRGKEQVPTNPETNRWFENLMVE